MFQNQLIDIWRMQHPYEKQYTWKRLAPEPILTRLDYFLISKNMMSIIPVAEIIPGYKMDHDMPYINMVIRTNKRGPGFWKLNTSLLDENEYIEQITQMIREEKAKPYATDMAKLDYIKYKVRKDSIAYASLKNKDRQNRLKAIECKIEEA